MAPKSSRLMSPQRDNLVMSSPLPAQRDLGTAGVEDPSPFKTDHIPTEAGQVSSGQTMPCNLLLLRLVGRAALSCFVPWLVLTIAV